MAITAYAEQTALSVSSTELSLISGTSALQNDTTAGVYQLLVDGANMALGDEYLIQVYEKVRGGGTKQKVFSVPLKNVQATLFVTPPLTLLNGWDMTIKKTAGADRAFDTSIRKVG